MNISMNLKKLCIFGVGGFGKETLTCFMAEKNIGKKDVSKHVLFIDDDKSLHGRSVMGVKVISRNEFDLENHSLVVAIADTRIRETIVNSFSKETNFATIIHPTAMITDWTEIGEGSIITASSVLNCNVKLGKHGQVNPSVTIGHDTEIGDFFTATPSASISGNCKIDDHVYFGTNSSIKQGLKVCSDVMIGMGSAIVRDISSKGIYAGVPAKKIK